MRILVESHVAAFVVDTHVDGDAEIERVDAGEVVPTGSSLPHLTGVASQIERQRPFPCAVHTLAGVEQGPVAPARAIARGRRIAPQQAPVGGAERKRPVVGQVNDELG